MLRECVQSILRPQIDLQPTRFVLEVDSYEAFLKKNEKTTSDWFLAHFGETGGRGLKNRHIPLGG